MDNWLTGTMVFVMIWWLIFFMVLPWGIKPLEADDVGRGHDAAAPQKPRIVTKMIIATAITAVLWGVAYWIAQAGLISFR